MDDEKLINAIIETAYEVHKYLPPGFLEKVYQRAMMIELESHNIKAMQEVQIPAYYKGICVGDFKADIMVEDRVLVELKAVDRLIPIHEVQLVNYLTITNIPYGLLINFGSHFIDIKRKFRDYKPKRNT